MSHRKSKRNKSGLFDLITGLRLPVTFPLLFLPGMEVGASGNINSEMQEGFKNTPPVSLTRYEKTMIISYSKHLDETKTSTTKLLKVENIIREDTIRTRGRT